MDERRIQNGLERVCSGEKGHYVYALIDPCDKETHKEKVFYIGEGIGTRVLAHVNEKEEQEKEIEKQVRDEFQKELEEVEKKDDQDLKEEIETNIKKEIARRKANLAVKIKTIEEIENEGKDVKHIIIKYGMTSKEAFYAESALINLLQYLYGYDPVETSQGTGLSNIKNGHATEKEKETYPNPSDPRRTKARTLEEFIEECDNEPLNVTQSKDPVLENAIFINVKGFAKYCQDDDMYWQAARGIWRMSIERANKALYVFALYGAVVKGVYKVNPGNVRSIIDDDLSEAPGEPEEGRQKEKEFLEKILAPKVKSIKDTGIRKKKDIKKEILKDKVIIDKFFEHRREEKKTEKEYQDSIRSCISDALKGNSQKGELQKRVRELLAETDDWTSKDAKALFIIINGKNHEELYDAWKTNELNKYLERCYFTDEARIKGIGPKLADKYKGRCLMKTVIDKTKVEKEVVLTDQNPVVYGKNVN